MNIPNTRYKIFTRQNFNVSRRDTKHTGFTLIETLITISIIAVLMSLSFVAFQGSRTSARDAKRKVDLESIRSALELYRSDNVSKTYPTGSGLASTILSVLVTNNYLSVVPSDPQSTRRYYYSAAVPGTTYQLCANFETGAALDLCGNNNCTIDCNYRTINP